MERDRGSGAAQGERLGCKRSCLSSSGASNGLRCRGVLLPWGSFQGCVDPSSKVGVPGLKFAPAAEPGRCKPQRPPA